MMCLGVTMPAYPDYVLVSLLEIGGNSCGTIQQRCEWVADADPPTYTRTNAGDMPMCQLKRTILGGGAVTWDLTLFTSIGACAGFHFMRRSTAADDPTGNYCKLSGSTIDCDAGKAAVADDD